MADKQARVLTQPSNRAKPKDAREKKVIFKGVLDSPFRIHWPSVPLNSQNALLATILQRLEGAAEYHRHRATLNRKRKWEEKATNLGTFKKSKPASEDPSSVQDKTDGSNQDSSDITPATDIDMISGDVPSLGSLEDATHEPPSLLRHLVFGINAVTKILEDQAQAARRPIIASIPELPTAYTRPPLTYVFVCRADVDPPILIDHLPHLVAAYNSALPKQHIALVPLPQGSEVSLAQALGVRRVSVLGVDAAYPDAQSLQVVLGDVPILAAPWLTPASSAQQLIPTNVKHLRTTTPKDMKAAKESRNEGRALAKERRSSGDKAKKPVASK